MFFNNTGSINAMDEVAFYYTIDQLPKQFVTSKLGSQTQRQLWTCPLFSYL